MILRTNEDIDPDDRLTEDTRVKMASELIDDIACGFFNLNVDFLPYTHTSQGVFDQARTERFIGELLKILDEYTSTVMRGKTFYMKWAMEEFYHAFFYLVIRLHTFSSHDMDAGMTPFTLFIKEARRSRTDLNMDEFLNRYLALPDNRVSVCSMGGMIGYIEDHLTIMGRSGFYMRDCFNTDKHRSASEAYIRSIVEDYTYEEITGRDFDEYRYLEDIKNNSRYNEDSFPNMNEFLRSITDYFNGMFKYANDEFVDNVTAAVKIFLSRNGHSVVSNTADYLAAYKDCRCLRDKLDQFDS